jgi:hypothetical protein
MPKKIVDAYDEDGQVFASYPIILNHMNMPLNDEHYVQEAKECHEEDGLSPSLVEKWVVRDPRPDEA